MMGNSEEFRRQLETPKPNPNPGVIFGVNKQTEPFVNDELIRIQCFAGSNLHGESTIALASYKHEIMDFIEGYVWLERHSKRFIFRVPLVTVSTATLLLECVTRSCFICLEHATGISLTP
jgi:hypothetical protein